MKKWYQMIVKAIEVTKKYNQAEVKQLSWLFTYLNAIDIDEEWFKTWVSAKWLWKLLNPLTKTWNNQKFDDWWISVSNLSRLKENIDYKRSEIIIKLALNKPSFDISEISETSNDSLSKGRWWKRDSYWTKEVDYILTLRAWEYCAVLTKWDSWDLYRRFIFDIKDEFLRLVFREWKSIETRNEFTKSIGNLDFMKQLKEKNPKEVWTVYWEVTNLIYLELFGVKAIEYKENNNISKKYFAKDFFTKDWLLDLEKLENKLAVIIEFLEPKTKDDLKKVIVDFLNKEIKWKTEIKILSTWF
jgi:hypothetical protein